MPAPSIVVLASGDGSLAEALIRAAQDEAAFQVAALVTDRSDINALRRAASLSIQSAVVDFDSFPARADWEDALSKVIASFDPWLVVSAGFMRVLSPEFLTKFLVINSHPSLLPLFPGAHAVRDALAAGESMTGCTVHFVDAGIDTGPVIEQREVVVYPSDTEATLHERIKEIERVLLPKVVAKLAFEITKVADGG